MFNIGDMFGKIKTMQAEMEKTRERLSSILVYGESGAGLVKVTANANRKILMIEVDPSIVDRNDAELMTDLITAAVNQAIEKGEARGKEELAKVSQAMLPGVDLSKFGL
jgi:DNA-binding YbaB/EbfC family protein